MLLPDVVVEYKRLARIRNKSIHFDPVTDQNDRTPALEAIQTLSKIISWQFGGFGRQPWFIPDIPGASYIKKEFERTPFVKTIYLPNCVLVGPYHRVELKPEAWGTTVNVIDQDSYENGEITDEEFAEILKKS